MGFKKEVEKVETPIEENKVTEEVVDDIPEVEVDEAENVSHEFNNELIDKERQLYLESARKIKIWGYISTAILMVLLIGSFVLMMTIGQKEETKWVSYLMIGIMILGLIGSFLFGRYQKKALDKAAEKYINLFFEEKVKYVFNIKEAKEVKFIENLDNKEDVLKTRFYKDIQGTKSRQFVNFKLGEKEVRTSDTASFITIKGRTSPKFLGKLVITDIDYPKPTRILFQLKGVAPSIPVDDIEGLDLKEGNDVYLIYSNDPDYKEYLTPKVIGLLRKYKVKSPILDVILSITENRLSIGISYDDNFINIPVNNSVDLKKLAKEKADLENAVAIIKEFK